MKVPRYFVLVLLNLFGWYLLGMAHMKLELAATAPDWLVFSVTASWGFPTVPLAYVLPEPPHRSAIGFAMLISVPLLRAAMVECLIRRFVDRPKDSDTG